MSAMTAPMFHLYAIQVLGTCSTVQWSALYYTHVFLRPMAV